MRVGDGVARVLRIDGRGRTIVPDTSPEPAGIAVLFDHVRILNRVGATWAVVLTAAARTVDVSRVAKGLAAHAERRGVPCRIGQIREGDGGVLLTSGTGDRALLALNGGAAPVDIDAWLARMVPRAGLAILEAPPLSESITGALLARACDGLVIVAEIDRTTRADLREAAERARQAGCTATGVVTVAAAERPPGWLHRLLGRV